MIYSLLNLYLKLCYFYFKIQMIKIRLLTFYEKNITSKFYKRYYEEKKISWKSLEIILKYI